MCKSSYGNEGNPSLICFVNEEDMTCMQGSSRGIQAVTGRQDHRHHKSIRQACNKNRAITFLVDTLPFGNYR